MSTDAERVIAAEIVVPPPLEPVWDAWATGAGTPRVTLRHDGWGAGGEWDESFACFERAWTRTVLPRLRHRFEHGPVDWADPPRFA